MSRWGELIKHDTAECYGPDGQPWADGMCRCLCASCEECEECNEDVGGE